MERPRSLKCSTPYCRNKRVHHRTICEKCKSRLYKERNPLAYHFNVLRVNAKRRGKQFDLTLEDFKAFCISSGYMEGKGRTAQDLSIDRIRPWEGYNINNIQVLTLSENSKKKFTDLEEDCPF